MKTTPSILTKLLVAVILITAFSSESYSQKTYYTDPTYAFCLSEDYLKVLVTAAQKRDRATYKKMMDDEYCSTFDLRIAVNIVSVRFQGRIVEFVSPNAPDFYLFTTPDALGLPKVLRE